MSATGSASFPWDSLARQLTRASVAAAVTFLALIGFCASPWGSTLFDVLFVLLMLLSWMLTAIWRTVLAIRIAATGRALAAVPLLILPAVALSACIFAAPISNFASDTGDELHFLVMRQSWLAEIAATRSTREPALVEFDFGGMIWFHNGIVYDESDEMSLPYESRSKAWKARADEVLECEPDARPFLRFTGLAQHFFLDAFPC